MPRHISLYGPSTGIWKGLTICGALFLCYFASSTSAAPIDLSLHLSCIQAEWVNVIEFFLVNYIAHAATVPAWPGASFRNNVEWTIVTLLFPFAGLANSLSTMIHYFYHHNKGNSVQNAIGTKALVVAIPEDLRHKKPFGYDAQIVNPDEFTIHGTFPEQGYILVRPRCETLMDIVEHDLEDTARITVPRSALNSLKMAISVAQLFFGCITLYRARGAQIDKYGYAAFGLTVFPYVFMTMNNLLFEAFVGEYPCIYLLNTRLVRGREKEFQGSIGVLKPPQPDDKESPNDYENKSWEWRGYPHTVPTASFMMLTLILHAIPPLFILALTHFKKKQSTIAERAWTMAWLGSSQISAFILGFVAVFCREKYTSTKLSDSPLTLTLFTILSPAAIGGLVVVGQMIMDTGTCGLGQGANS